jgi:xanthine/uracil permease
MDVEDGVMWLFAGAELATLIAALHVGLGAFTEVNLLGKLPEMVQMLVGTGAVVGSVRGLWHELAAWK